MLPSRTRGNGVRRQLIKFFDENREKIDESFLTLDDGTKETVDEHIGKLHLNTYKGKFFFEVCLGYVKFFCL
jgi:hypothetical protein